MYPIVLLDRQGCPSCGLKIHSISRACTSPSSVYAVVYSVLGAQATVNVMRTGCMYVIGEDLVCLWCFYVIGAE